MSVNITEFGHHRPITRHRTIKHGQGESPFPCKTNKLAREIPACRWYQSPVTQMFATGCGRRGCCLVGVDQGSQRRAQKSAAWGRRRSARKRALRTRFLEKHRESGLGYWSSFRDSRADLAELGLIGLTRRGGHEEIHCVAQYAFQDDCRFASPGGPNLAEIGPALLGFGPSLVKSVPNL